LSGIFRTSYYYKPAPESEKNLMLMRLIDEQYMKRPYYGYPRMTDWLREQGYLVNYKRISRLMKKMGIQAVTPGPHTSKPAPEHTIYPYLLRGLDINRPHQVWSTDITYIPMNKGFMYLVAVIDWYSRFVLSWEISNSLDTSFCISALENALTKGCPEIFNTDQGAQFTSNEFVTKLIDKGIAVSMDGRGRALDNVFIERLWWSVKYEEVYINDYNNGNDLCRGLLKYFRYYNNERPHQSLEYKTPSKIYHTLDNKIDRNCFEGEKYLIQSSVPINSPVLSQEDVQGKTQGIIHLKNH